MHHTHARLVCGIAQAVEVRAKRAIAAGEELYADYGKDPRSLGYLG
jgi:hypothetical protein